MPQSQPRSVPAVGNASGTGNEASAMEAERSQNSVGCAPWSAGGPEHHVWGRLTRLPAKYDRVGDVEPKWPYERQCVGRLGRGYPRPSAVASDVEAAAR
jgi:hypothetical protein